MLLKFARIGLLDIPVLVHPTVKTSVGRLIHICEQQRLTRGRPVVETRAPVAMATHSNLEVERAVHPVLLGSKNRSKMLRHGSGPPPTFGCCSRELINNLLPPEA